MAAEATQRLLGQDLVAIEAANRLLDWLAARFGRDAPFATHVACRLVGHATAPFWPATARMLEWTSAQAQLEVALRVDDALFAVEEQNLFVDEVRETQRWSAVFAQLECRPEETWFRTLVLWVREGLAALTEAAGRDDGPLGWTSQPAVFALCTRVILSAGALRRSGHCNDVDALLEALVVAGRGWRFHPLLLEMAESQMS